MSWTRRALQTDTEAVEIVLQVAARLASEEAQFLVKHRMRRVGELYMINADRLEFQITDRTQYRVGAKSGTVHDWEILSHSIAGEEPLRPEDFADDYFRREFTKPLSEAVPIEAEEHSGQVSGDERKAIEAKFRDPQDPLNVLVCTPTMELGIDIGQLSAVYMRNVPPSPSNYAQRAGRAGRKGQPAIVSTFCGVGSFRGPHDQYFYRFPEKIIAGKIGAPRFLLDNPQLLRTHIHSLVLETIDLKLPSRPAGDGGQDGLLQLEVEGFPLWKDLKESLEDKIDKGYRAITRAVQEAFAAEIAGFAWFDARFVEQCVRGFVQELDHTFDRWRQDYENLDQEIRDIQRQLRQERHSYQLSNRQDIISKKLESMREGRSGYYTYRYLGAQGFLPNYAFPRQATSVAPSDREEELYRDQGLALREYAPGNSIYYRGSRYVVTFARPRTSGGKLDPQPLLICPHCHSAFLGSSEVNKPACPVCHQDLSGVHPNERALTMPDMYAQRRSNITSDEEERRRLGYAIEPHYRVGAYLDHYVGKVDGVERLHLYYEHNGRIIRVNKGPRQLEDDQPAPGFAICQACHKWLLSEGQIQDHYDQDKENSCTKGGVIDRDLIGNAWVYTDSLQDVVTIKCPLPREVGIERAEDFATTLLHALLQGLQIALNVDESEVSGFIAPEPQEAGYFRVIIYEASEGGAGAVQLLKDEARLRQVLLKAREIMHEGEEGCEKVCYDCLCSFHNQLDHERMNRHLVLPLFRELAEIQLERISESAAGASFEELLAKCQRTLEPQVLRRIRDRGMRLPDAAQHLIVLDGVPVAQADFYYDPKVVVFVDGSPHYLDYVASADVSKRNKLKAKGYRIVGISGEDIEGGLDRLEEMVG